MGVKAVGPQDRSEVRVEKTMGQPHDSIWSLSPDTLPSILLTVLFHYLWWVWDLVTSQMLATEYVRP